MFWLSDIEVFISNVYLCAVPEIKGQKCNLQELSSHNNINVHVVVLNLVCRSNIYIRKFKNR